MSDLIRIPFHGDELWAVERDGKAFVAVKRVCEMLGVAEQSQAAKLKSCAWAVTTMIVAPGPDGKNYEMLGVDLDSFPQWMVTIHASKVAPEARPMLLRLQREAKQVLADHFFKRTAAPQPAPGLSREDVIVFVRELVPIIVELVRPQATPRPSATPAFGTPLSSLDSVHLAALRRSKGELVALGMKVGRWKNPREGQRKIQGLIAEATGGYGQWGGATLRLMPVQLFPVAQRALASLRIDLERQDAILFGDNKDGTKQNVLPFMRNGLTRRRGDEETCPPAGASRTERLTSAAPGAAEEQS
jgi:hypothetical protein